MGRGCRPGQGRPGARGMRQRVEPASGRHDALRDGITIEENQADGQAAHAGHQAIDRFVTLRVALGGRQQFVQRQEHHHPGDQAEYPAEGGVVEDAGQGEIANRGPHRFGQAGQQAGTEGVDLVLRGEVHRDGDRDAFGDVVDGDGEGQRHAHRRAFQSGKKGGQAFREVVRSDRDRGQQADPLDIGLVVVAEQRVLLVQAFVRVRDQMVDQHDQQHAGQEGHRAVGEAGPRVVGQGEGIDGLVEDLGQRHEHHRPAREGQPECQQTGIGALREQHHQAAQAGGQAGSQGHQQGDPYVVARNIQHALPHPLHG